VGAAAAFGPTTLVNGSADTSSTDLFLAKYDGGGALLWAKGVPGASSEEVWQIVADPSGNIYLTGDFDVSISIGGTTLTGNHDMFIAKYDTDSNPLWGRTGVSSGSNDEGYSVAADAARVYVAGVFSGPSIIFGSVKINNMRTTGSGYGDMFIVRYDADGNVVWAKGTGGTGDDAAGWAVSDDSGVDVAGSFQSAAVVFGPTTLDNAKVNSADVLVVKYDPKGKILWAQRAGGSGNDFAGLAIDGRGNLYLSGTFDGPSIDVGSTTLNNQGGTGTTDLFFAKLESTLSVGEFSEGGVEPSFWLDPLTGTLRVTLPVGACAVTVFDLIGQPLIRRMVNGERSLEINLADLPVGWYLVEAIDRNRGRHSAKLIRQ
jgi:hypothetical protein